MVKTFLLIIFIIFSVTGICDFIYILKMLFYFPNVRNNQFVLIFLKKGYALKQLNYIWQKIKWHGDGFAYAAIAITDNLDTKDIENCKKFIKNKNIILCSAVSLQGQILGELFDGNR